MLNNDSNKKIFLEWLNKAKDDELSVEVILKENGAPSTACFLSQQMAEKYLKGFLAFHGKLTPQKHDLLFLLTLCEQINADFVKLQKSAQYLNKFYIITRYPADYPEGFSFNQAKEAFDHAQIVKDLVNELLFDKIRENKKTKLKFPISKFSKLNKLSILSFGLVVLPWLYAFSPWSSCGNLASNLSLAAGLIAFVVFIYLVLKKRGGGWLSLLSFLLGLLGFFVLITFC